MDGARRRGIFFSLSVVLTTGLAPAPLDAQSTGSARDLDSVLVSSDVGRRVRVGTGLSFVEGSLVEFGARTLELRSESGDHRIELGPGDSLWAAVDAKRTGALVGALAGVVLTAGFCLETFDECGLDVGLLIVTPALALIGAGIGAQLTSWRPLIPGL